MDYYSISGLFNTVVSFSLGVYVLLKNPKSSVNKSLFFWCAALGSWSLFYFVWQLERDGERALLWTRLLMVGAIFVPITYFHLVITFLRNRERIHHAFLLVGYVLALVFMALLPTHLMVDRVEPAGGFPYWPMPGKMYLVYLIYFFGYTLYSVMLAYRAIGTASSIMQRQIKFMLFGIAISIIGGSTNYFLWYGVPIKPYGNIFASAYVIFTVYAIMRYRLLNVKVIATEIFVGALLIISFMDIAVARSFTDGIVKAFIFLIIVVFSYMIIANTKKEIRRGTELQTLADRLAMANQRLKKLDQAKSEFISIASHQLRTPLTSIKGFISLILEGSYGPVVPEVQNALNKVYMSNERLIQLVEDLLSISRIESGRIKFDMKKTDMVQLAKEVVEMFVLRAKEKGLDLVVDVPHNEKIPEIPADANKMREVLSNLIDNAIKYTDKGSVTISIHRHIDTVRITIADTGMGVDSEDVPYLFQKFSRGKNVDRVHANGTGLGLYVGKNIVEAHHGRIWVESDGKDSGSKFHVELPVKDVNKESGVWKEES